LLLLQLQQTEENEVVDQDMTSKKTG